jgi:hypothetical protein
MVNTNPVTEVSVHTIHSDDFVGDLTRDSALETPDGNKVAQFNSARTLLGTVVAG